MNYMVFILPFSLLVLSDISFADSAAPKSTYDWTGVYVGGFVGGATGANISSQLGCPTCVPMYIESSNYHNSTGGISTAKIGVNYKF